HPPTLTPLSPPYPPHGAAEKKAKKPDVSSASVIFCFKPIIHTKRPGFVPDRYLLKIDSCCR
ncbi:hypothetical protein, partial [Escherichia coli]|uniref:hypothetical protein n=1 Tax=Escherichia coli TaxID=562 RepID=UPI002FC5D1CE